jgi:hypothetical protein
LLPQLGEISVKAVVLLLSTLGLVVTVFLAGMAFTAYVVAEPEPHRFANMDAPDLWTSKPVAIDQQKQHYERVAPAAQLASLPASDDSMATGNATASADKSDTASVDPGVDQMQTGALSAGNEKPVAALDPAHADWCFGRYRSYRAEDNTYQPFGGGPRRVCESPWTPMPEDGQAQSDDQRGEDVAALSARPQNAAYSDTAAPVGAHEEWCFARYRSYRVEDNSYQPFGGPRRACVSPYG